MAQDDYTKKLKAMCKKLNDVDKKLNNPSDPLLTVNEMGLVFE